MLSAAAKRRPVACPILRHPAAMQGSGWPRGEQPWRGLPWQCADAAIIAGRNALKIIRKPFNLCAMVEKNLGR
jgi:hypothetical protein